MSSSDGAVSTAKPSRGSVDVLCPVASSCYRIILPTLPTGTVSLNTVVLHADINARPYKVEHFQEALSSVIKIDTDVLAMGVYQMNHVWMVTLHSASAKEKLIKAKELDVKGSKCLVIDPNEKEIPVKLHWLPFYVADEDVRNALAQYGKLLEIQREKWSRSGMENIFTTTRTARLRLGKGLTIDDVPHQVRINGGTVLITAQGRPPLCLKCKKMGHVRRDCQAVKCTKCLRFGHPESECVMTYALVAESRDRQEEIQQLTMDQAEMDTLTQPGRESGAPVLSVLTESTPVTSKEVKEKGMCDIDSTENSQQGIGKTDTEAADMVSSFRAVISESVGMTGKETDASKVAGANLDAGGSKASKRTVDEASEMDVEGEDGSTENRRKDTKWKMITPRRTRHNPAPRIKVDDRRRGLSQ